uniref:Uncharacterized protein n=1 Tax=Anguilla anguilla TaxID=7936 RepID=A0A0E9PXZ4_ANGAN
MENCVKAGLSHSSLCKNSDTTAGLWDTSY